MAKRVALILASIGLAATSAPAQETAVPLQDAAVEPAPELKSLAETCAAHKFETMVTRGDLKRATKVKICGKPGQTDADWLNTLKDSIRQAEANNALSQPVKDQIVAALKSEISRLESPAARPPAATITGLSPEVAAPREPAPQYSILPPLPNPKPRVAASSRGTAPLPPKKPRLTVRCSSPGEGGGSVPCASLKRETMLTIRADEDLGPGVGLRFLRGGDQRADLDLGALRSGQSLRSRLPGRVCSGVLRGKVKFQIVSAGQVVETLGPYGLYCGS